MTTVAPSHGEGTPGKFVGRSVARREDPRLLTGRGRFVDDISMPGMLHAQFVRSTVAAGSVTALDVSDVVGVDGVRA
ncbi:hypothetical protein, partial [Rhodococcus sp. (in: high G+C Gram-positive bacteria)]|uniref:hypothetical protein n=1 Tax=Rhodococcus sp. TaxID=1831 RepID=UPI001A00BE1E